MENPVTPQSIYDQLWSQGHAALERGQPQIDPFLTNKKSDLRRAYTLVFRPDAEVRKAVGKFLMEAERVAPEQYFYGAGEFHTTVLGVIPGSVTWQQRLSDLPRMRRLIAQVCREKKAFDIEYRGVTTSMDAVMIQGFPRGDTLTQLRDALRSAFNLSGVGADIDRRYKISAAHITVMRYAALGTDWKRLLELLRVNRTTEFGKMRVGELQLISGDWYASAESVEIVDTYELPEP
ncbi:MAG TPA: 2'-5' RNA ligase family protein [Verrucomicrobiae bacterium]|jgi:2'-5' RNA ligase|nr:2'-5' RNA ligase family protein [Verrucomicrobiae bacterium]